MISKRYCARLLIIAFPCSYLSIHFKTNGFINDLVFLHIYREVFTRGYLSWNSTYDRSIEKYELLIWWICNIPFKFCIFPFNIDFVSAFLLIGTLFFFFSIYFSCVKTTLIYYCIFFFFFLLFIIFGCFLASSSFFSFLISIRLVLFSTHGIIIK